MGKIFRRQSALRITLRTFTDLEDAVSACIRYRKPNGSIGEFTAVIGDRERGIIFYEIKDKEINVSGWWKFWAFVTFFDGRTAAGEAARVYVWDEGK